MSARSLVQRVARAMWAEMQVEARDIGMPVPADSFDELHPYDQKRQLRIAQSAIDMVEADIAERGTRR